MSWRQWEGTCWKHWAPRFHRWWRRQGATVAGRTCS